MVVRSWILLVACILAVSVSEAGQSAAGTSALTDSDSFGGKRVTATWERTPRASLGDVTDAAGRRRKF
jgi:hypothetical protein